MSEFCTLTPFFREGLKNIEDVQTGELVWSRHESKPELSGWRPVTATMTTHPSEIYHITYEVEPQQRVTSSRSHPLTETIGTTFNHPFWVLNRSTPCFLPAGALQTGDTLALASGGTAEITRIKSESAAEGQTFTTYNFEVADYHTYFVGSSAVWVHNNCRWYEFTERLAEGFDGVIGKGNPAKAWAEMLDDAGPGLSQADKASFLDVLWKNELDPGPLDPRIVRYATDLGKGFQAQEAFTLARYEKATGRTLIGRDPPRFDPITGRQLKGGDAVDDLGRVVDAVGPLPGEALADVRRLEGFYREILEHIDEMPKGNPIVDLAGLPNTLKDRALNLVKSRLANPSQIQTGVELLLDNGKRIILLAD